MSLRKKDLKMNDESYKAKDKALSLLNYRMRTEKELKSKLIAAEFSEEAADEAVEYVKSFGYLDDRTYADQYVASRRAAKGDIVLRRELREKGVDEEIISEVLKENETDPVETACALIVKKYGRPHALDEKEYRRAFGFLARRGFSSHDVFTALKRYGEADAS